MKVFNSVSDLQAASLTAGQLTSTKGYTTAGDGGGATYLIKTAVDYGGVLTLGDHTLANGNVAVLQAQNAFNARQFGALGDGTGSTPNDTGEDITNAEWNTWDNTPFKDNLSWSPYGGGGVFSPPRAKPFANDDTWDFIGISLALWSAANTQRGVYIPAGDYLINIDSTTSKGSYNGLVIMKGMEQSIFGDGPYETKIRTKEDSTYFAANNVGVLNAYRLFSFYRIGGPPTNLRDISLQGPTNYAVANQNLTLLHCSNINGVTIRDCWFSVGHYGIYSNDNSGDSHIKGCTMEYMFGAGIYTDATSDFTIDFCNLWASASVTSQIGIQALGKCDVRNSRFVEFDGGAFFAATGVFSNNFVTVAGAVANTVSFTSNCIISDNTITGNAVTAFISVVENASITGNNITHTSNHPCIDAGDGTVNSAVNIVVVGNVFIKTNSASEPQNYAIIALESGVGYTGAATPSLLIANNSFQGRALNPINDATLVKNTFDGVLQQAVFAENVETDGSLTTNSVLNQHGDVLGKQVMTASAGTTGTYNITVTGAIGIGQGDSRSQERLNLITVRSNGSGHIVIGWALYSSQYTGNALLVSTLGKYEIGGTITFGTSGNNPYVTITNSGGGTPTYYVNAVPLI